MKEAIIIVLVLVFTFVPNVIFKNFLDKSGKEIIEILDDMNNDFLYNKEFDSKKAEKLKKEFLDKENKWIMIVDHEILDEIEGEIEYCIVSYNEEDKMEFGASYSKVKNHIQDLEKREEVSLENIL